MTIPQSRPFSSLLGIIQTLRGITHKILNGAREATQLEKEIQRATIQYNFFRCVKEERLWLDCKIFLGKTVFRMLENQLKSIHVLKEIYSSLLSLSVDIDLRDIRWVSELWLVSPIML